MQTAATCEQTCSVWGKNLESSVGPYILFLLFLENKLRFCFLICFFLRSECLILRP